jgi:hypothetical protein
LDLSSIDELDLPIHEAAENSARSEVLEANLATA